MVICPIARAVHCTGCPFFKFCPAKTTLGDYGKELSGMAQKTKKANKTNAQGSEQKSDHSKGGSH